MTEKDSIVKRLRSCFICGIEIYNHKIVLEDSGRSTYTVLREDKPSDALESFNRWFKDVYLKGIPQILTVIDYRIEEDEDGVAHQVVNKIVSWTNISNSTRENIDGKQA